MPERSGSILGTLALVGLVAAGAALIVTASYEFSHERIVENERAQLLGRLHSVLDPEVAALNPNPVPLTVTAPELLGTDEPVDVFVAVENGVPLGTVIASVAPDGYNAPIRLLVGIAPDGTLTGVRVVSHRETPGLGDKIEVEKSDWIRQFDDKSLGDPPPAQWTVEKERVRLADGRHSHAPRRDPRRAPHARVPRDESRDAVRARARGRRRNGVDVGCRVTSTRPSATGSGAITPRSCRCWACARCWP